MKAPFREGPATLACMSIAMAVLCATVASAAPRKRAPAPAKSAAPAAPAAPTAPSPSTSTAEPADPKPPPDQKPAASAEKTTTSKRPPSSQADATPASDGASANAGEGYGHHMQGSLRVEGVIGYRMMLRYDQSPRCGPYKNAPASDQQKFCGFGMPPAIGLALGFSVVDFFEPFVFARFGLADERDHTNAGKAVAFGLGARLYTISDSPLKVFFTPWLGIDTTSGPVDPADPGDKALGISASNFRTDLLVHLDGGPQLDFSRNVGVYLSAGLTMGLLRYLSGNAELALGLQLRAP